MKINPRISIFFALLIVLSVAIGFILNRQQQASSKLLAMWIAQLNGYQISEEFSLSVEQLETQNSLFKTQGIARFSIHEQPELIELSAHYQINHTLNTLYQAPTLRAEIINSKLLGSEHKTLTKQLLHNQPVQVEAHLEEQKIYTNLTFPEIRFTDTANQFEISPISLQWVASPLDNSQWQHNINLFIESLSLTDSNLAVMDFALDELEISFSHLPTMSNEQTRLAVGMERISLKNPYGSTRFKQLNMQINSNIDEQLTTELKVNAEESSLNSVNITNSQIHLELTGLPSLELRKFFYLLQTRQYFPWQRPDLSTRIQDTLLERSKFLLADNPSLIIHRLSTSFPEQGAMDIRGRMLLESKTLPNSALQSMIKEPSLIKLITLSKATDLKLKIETSGQTIAFRDVLLRSLNSEPRMFPIDQPIYLELNHGALNVTSYQ